MFNGCLPPFDNQEDVDEHYQQFCTRILFAEQMLSTYQKNGFCLLDHWIERCAHSPAYGPLIPDSMTRDMMTIDFRHAKDTNNHFELTRILTRKLELLFFWLREPPQFSAPSSLSPSYPQCDSSFDDSSHFLHPACDETLDLKLKNLITYREKRIFSVNVRMLEHLAGILFEYECTMHPKTYELFQNVTKRSLNEKDSAARDAILDLYKKKSANKKKSSSKKKSASKKKSSRKKK